MTYDPRNRTFKVDPKFHPILSQLTPTHNMQKLEKGHFISSQD